MRKILKKVIIFSVAASMVFGTTGCSHKKSKTPKPKPQSTVVVDNGNTDATGKGDGQSDVPLVIGCNKLSKKFNPFVAKSEDDKQAVDLTQTYLLVNDRQGQIIYNGIDGEVKTYNGNDYTYYGPADIEVGYNARRDETVYRITIRDDLLFSDGEPVTIDDVIFTMYVLCDNDYRGSSTLGIQNIKGLLNYQADNNNAEKISNKRVQKYIKKMPAALKKWVNKNSGLMHGKEYNAALEREARKQIASKLNIVKRVKKITGIRRINDYNVSITTNGYDKDMIKALQIPICPLHYYGDLSKYDYNKNKFGFKKGDISSVCANKSSPIGAGPYRFVKYEKNIIYYASNEIYYKGCPKIAYVQLKEMNDILKLARSKIKKAVSEENTLNDNAEAVERTSAPEGTINHNAEALEMAEGTVDVLDATLSAEDIFWISQVNSNGKISGSKITTKLIPTGVYQYIGINADTVKVGSKALSKRSRNLRKALSTALSAFRNELFGYYSEAVHIIQYPYASDSWLSLQEDDSEYSYAYALDLEGKEIYDEDTDEDKKYERVKEAVLSYLVAAGYTVKDGVVSAAPRGASKTYSVMMVSGPDNPLYQMVYDASSMLDEIGITLNIVPLSNERSLINRLERGNHQIWVGVCDTNSDYNLYERYGSPDNLFSITSTEIKRIAVKEEKYVEDTELKELYKRCYDKLFNMSVELPVNELQTAILYSSARIDIDTMTRDTTMYYDWVNEIENIEMK